MRFLIYEEKKLQNQLKVMNDINMLIKAYTMFILFLDRIDFLINV